MSQIQNSAVLVLAAVLSGFASSATAMAGEAYLSGADFLDACTRADMEWISFCNGYVQAIVDTRVDQDICLTSAVTRTSLVEVVVGQLATNHFITIKIRHLWSIPF
jgi:hypothetical protein